MLIAIDLEISFPRPLVYVTYRDGLKEQVAQMDSVERVEVKSRRQEQEQVYCVNEWHSNAQVPTPIRAVLGEKLFSWTESAIWNESDFTVRWSIQTHAFTEAVFCAGSNRFRAEGNKTVVENRGELKIDPEKLTEIPWLLRGQIAKLSENFLGQQTEENLKQMGEAVKKELEKSQTRERQ